MEVLAISHSLSGQLLGVLRDKSTPSRNFREALEQISLLLFWEASRDLDTTIYEVETPFETAMAARFEHDVVLIPILRAGLTMLPMIWKTVPKAVVEHIGVYRNEETLSPEPYYSSLDEHIEEAVSFILDPMLATGGTLSYALKIVAGYNPSAIEVLTVVSAPQGIEKLAEAADSISVDVRLWTAAIDRTLNENGYILPGLGDAGDRAFGTK